MSPKPPPSTLFRSIFDSHHPSVALNLVCPASSPHRLCARTAQPHSASSINQQSWIISRIRLIISMTSDTEGSSSSRIHRNSKSNKCGTTSGAFEPPLPPVVEDLRPWGAGESVGEGSMTGLGCAHPCGAPSRDVPASVLTMKMCCAPPRLQSPTAQASPT